MQDRKINELALRASQLAEEYESRYGGCSQAVVAAVKETLGGISDDVFKAATGLAGGIGLTGHTCGALTGGVMAISCHSGREYANFSDPGRVRFKTFKLAEKLQKKFAEEYGSSDCREIQDKIMGRYFDLRDPDEHAEYLKAGGHTDKCPRVCGNAARWVIEILAEENLI